jgi:GT2 family glycosyltransferase
VTDLLITPARGLRSDGPGGRWVAIDDDPQFAVTLPNRCRGRWLRLRVDITPELRWTSAPLLYLDCGSGYSELTTVSLPTPAEGSACIDLVLFLPANVVQVRFDPLAQPGPFTMGPLQMTPVTKAGAAIRMLAKVSSRLGRHVVLQRAIEGIVPIPTTARLRRFREWLAREYRAAPAERVRSYADWLARFDTRCDAVAQTGGTDYSAARISVLMAVTAPDERLPRAMGSLLAQHYHDWELCMAVSEQAQTAVLDLPPLDDTRIRRFLCPAIEVSELLNVAAANASGELVLALSPSDMLHPCALRLLAERAAARADAQLFFSDEDRLGTDAGLSGPMFKPEFNYELLLADWLAIGDLCAIRTGLLRDLGGFRPQFGADAGFDLALRALESSGPEGFEHIAHPLYHRSFDRYADADSPLRTELRKRVVTEHLRRRGLDAEVLPSGEAAGLLRVRHSLPSPRPLVSVIIPTRDRADLLRMCTDSLRMRSGYTNLELIVVDNNSKESETFALFDELARAGTKVLQDSSPFNFAGLNNLAARQASGEVLVLMNNDIEILTPDWVEEMLSFAFRPDVGAVGARLWFPDGSLQHAGVILGLGGVAGHGHKHLRRGEPGHARRALVHQQLSAVTAAALMVRRAVYLEIGGMDEQFEVAFNDVDFCLRLMQLGYRNIWTPHAEMIHHESASRGAETTPEKRERFAREVRLMRERWGAWLDQDPAYSPNLTLESEDFALAWPPRQTRSRNAVAQRWTQAGMSRTPSAMASELSRW